MIRYLLTSCLLLLFVSCATNNVVKDYKTIGVSKNNYTATYFSNPAVDYVYKANITVYGNELTGIFIAKKINETTHRVVFTTEFGNKLIDFEISENDFKVNSIVDELNRKILINTLKSDFRLLLRNEFQIIEQFEDENTTVYKSKNGNNFNYIFETKKENKIRSIVHSSKRKEKISFNFTSKNDTFAEKIIIQHTNIKLRIELNYFKTETN